MPITPPTPLEAELYHRIMESGQNRALLLSARGATGLVQCVVKLAARMAYPPLEYLTDWVAYAVGRQLGIFVPEPLSVHISHEFAEAIDESDARDDAMESCGSAFGSTFMPGYTQYAAQERVHPDLRTSAAELLAFDVFIHNCDRKPSNPNLLVGRDELVAIDHELAFEFLHPPPMRDPGRNPRTDLIKSHVFGQPLRGRPTRLDEFRVAVQGLSDTWFDELKAVTPVAWMVGPAEGKLDRIVDVLKERRDHVDEVVGAVSQWME